MCYLCMIVLRHLVLNAYRLHYLLAAMYLKSVNGTKTKLERCGGNFFRSGEAERVSARAHARVSSLVCSDIITAIFELKSMVVAIISYFSRPLSNYLVVNHCEASKTNERTNE